MKRLLLLSLLLLGAGALQAQSIRISNLSCSVKQVYMYADVTGNCFAPASVSNPVNILPGTMATFDMYPGGPNTALTWPTGVGPVGTYSFVQVRIIDPAGTPAAYNLGDPMYCTLVPASQPVTWPCTSLLTSNWTTPSLVRIVIRP